MKKLFCRNKEVKKHKRFEIDIFLDKVYAESGIEVDTLLLDANRPLNLYINLFYLLTLRIDWSRKTDHAGFSFDLTIFNFNFNINYYDTRHWDEDNNKFYDYE